MNSRHFSHIPVLAAAVVRYGGPVLELGSGIGSTLMLHGLCGALKFELTTLESDKLWFDMVKEFERKWHRISMVDTFMDLPEYSNRYTVAFVDHGIAEQRGHSVRSLKDSMVIVVHDTCHPHLYDYKCLDDFKYRYDMSGIGPMTSVVSNYVDVAEQFTAFNF